MGFLKDMRAFKQLADSTPRQGLRATLRDGLATASSAAEQAQRAQHLALHGLPGHATITTLRDTGTSINDNPLVELGLEVTLDGRAPYAVTHQQVISRLAVGGFQPGATVPVRVDPADPASVMVA
ncbi:hypothetical protein DVA67_013700 [Solirubrobacter sp. CPCC 204708]|uniref:DUF3592 domain-containing protein n=1 Tax=Solirubrobacter deserti TaxID=2282478 RepID=A0ABT4RC16_9ACTN|nr:hypothetical protein [Solirubrobacter deserti]MBE2317031.1 hypothetical protein [Solirubrobacter deserti]MDA0136077.1 DUF3592 domain-containing protein [Solirubrobacter deserti]